MTRIFLSYARGDDEAFVRRLYDDLRENGFEVWFDRVSMPSRKLKFLQEIRDAIADHDRLLLVVGPKAMTSDYVTQEWRNALEMDKCVNAIVRMNCQEDDGSTVDAYALIPAELKFLHAEDFRDDARYAEHLANLVRQLNELAPRLGKLVAVPTLPLYYLAQPDRLLDLRNAVLNNLERPLVVTGAAARIGVQGMGGIGKSVLAAALARDLEIRRAFPDGIFWVGVGQQPNVVDLQRVLAQQLGDRARFNDLHAGKQRLKRLLAKRSTLLILDDVWQSADANAFDVLGPRCKLLLTTRDAGLVNTMAATGYEVQLLTEAEGLVLLGKAAAAPVESLPAMATEIVNECGRLPLALALCGGMLQAGVTWRDLLNALHEHELEFLTNEHALEDHHRNLWRAMEISVRTLPENEQQRFAELAVFPTGIDVPEPAVLTLWTHTGMSERHARRLLVDFKQRSLVRLDRSTDTREESPATVWIHDLLHDLAARWFAQLSGNVAALHNQLVDAYSKRCRDGWHTGPNDGYFFKYLAYHLHHGHQRKTLAALLRDCHWLQAKTDVMELMSLVADFNYLSTRQPYRLIQSALRLAVHVISDDPKLLPGQLHARLKSHQDDQPVIRALLNGFRNSRSFLWLRPLSACLPGPGGPLLRTFAGERYEFSIIAMKPDGQQIIVSSGSRIQLMDPLDYREAITLRENMESRIQGLAPTPDGLGLALAMSDSMLRIVNLDNGLVVKEFIIGPEGTESIGPISVLPDGKSIAIAFASIIHVYNLTTGIRTHRLNEHAKVTAISITRDGRGLISASEDGTVRSWDLRTGESMLVLCEPGLKLTSVVIAADGLTVVSGADDNIIRISEMATGKHIARLEGHTDSVSALATCGPNKILSASWDGTIRGWDIKRQAELFCLLAHVPCVTQLTISKNGRLAASTGASPMSRHGDHLLKIWDLKAAGRRNPSMGHKTYITDVVISRDSQRIVSVSADRTLKVWDSYSGKNLLTLHGHKDAILAVALNGNGEIAASASGDHTVMVWDLVRGTELASLKGHNCSVYAVGITSDCRYVASGSEDGEVKIWDLSTGMEMRTFKGHKQPVMQIEVTDDDRFVISSAFTEEWQQEVEVKYWPLDEHNKGRTVKLPAESTRVWAKPVALNANGHIIIANSGFVFDIKRATRAHIPNRFGRGNTTLPLGTLAATVAVSASGKRALFGLRFGKVIAWDYDQELDMLDGVSCHSDDVLGVAITPDGNYAATASEDKSVKLWNLTRSEMMAEFRVEGWIGAFAISADGSVVVAGEQTGQLHLLRLNT